MDGKTIIMNVSTGYHGELFEVKQEVLVSKISKKVAYRWVSRGLAHWPGDDDKGIEVFEKTTIKVKLKKNEPTSIIIPVHGGIGYLKNCIDSIVRYTNNFEVIVVDNHSPNTDISDHAVIFKDFDLTVVTNKENMGFSYACDQGIKIAKHDFICFLNSDTLVTPNWLHSLQKCFNLKNVSLASPTTCYSRGKQEDKSIRDKRFKMSDVDILSYASSLKKGFEQTEVYGLCMLTTKSVLDKVGVFDYKRYGLGNYEENDFQWRAEKLGYKSYWVKDSYVHHFGSITFRKLGLNNLKENEKVFEQRKLDKNLFIKNDVKLGKIKKIKKAKVNKTIDSVKIGYVPHQNINAISFRLAAGVTLRVLNIAKHLKNSVISYNYEDLKDCKVVIFQAKWSDEDVELAKRLKDNGVKLVFDTTDPHWDIVNFDKRGKGKKCLDRILKYVDVMFLPTEGLKKSFLKYREDKRIEIVPDSIDLSAHKGTRKHTSKDIYNIVWFGSRSNICQIKEVREDLEKLGKEFKLKLTAVYDKDFGIEIEPFENIELEVIDWTDEITINTILKSDVVINPKYDNWKSYKSNNKTIKALALGVPCVEKDFYNKIKELLLSADLRNKEGKKGKEIVKEFDSKNIAKKVAKICDGLTVKRSKRKKKIAIVTAIAGGFDGLHDPTYYDEDVDYFAYVDKDVKSDIWQIKPIEFTHFTQPRVTAKLYKILIHRFCDYDYTLWIDGSLVMRNGVGELIDKYMGRYDMALFKHRMRDCVYEEHLASFRNKHHAKGEPDSIRKEQIEKYKDEGLPKKSGLYECTFILRKNNKRVQRFNNDWMAEINRFSSSDQVPFMYAKWKNPDVRIATITPGDVHNSKWAYYINHKY